MEWKLSDEQSAYQETLRGWLSDTAPVAAVRAWLDDGDEQAFEGHFGRAGWAGVGIPEALGGQGGGLVELVLTAEELARAAVPSSAWLATVLTVPALAGSPEALGEAFDGKPVALLASADEVPDAAPVLAMDAAGRLSGSVPRVLAGSCADSFVAVVRAGEGRALRLVRADAVEKSARRLLDRSRSVADVRLESVPSEPLPAEGEAFLREYAVRAAVLAAADALGATERMLALAVEYSKQRHQFGVPIGSFQAVKHAAATILVGTEAGRSVLYYAAAAVDAGESDCGLYAAAAKAQITAESARAADSALTMHGAIGYTWEHDLHLFFKRAKLDEYLFGTPAQWNERIADGLRLV
ncbi:acyl-CoA dehydrogenase family protein [Amycolatopsis ultiminotia]|uniref:Acyl-CoA dehydrogenase family protein n=1 Tax=Amycolatopsis ultiminotia TaxID=543629 RepID=A0ABP6UY40_9PSEU